MKNNFYKTVPIKNFNGITKNPTIFSTLYKSIDSCFEELNYSQFIKIIDWKKYTDIKNSNTKKLISIAFKNITSQSEKEKIYIFFIENFLAKFIFSNDLPLTIDTIRLFQADFLGWKDHEII